MKRNVIIATLAAAGVIAGGVVAGTAMADDDRDSTPRTLRTADGGAPQPRTDEGDDRPAASVSAADAVQRALKEVPGRAAGLEQEEDDRRWEVDVIGEDGSWRLVEVDRSTGDVRTRTERDDDDDDRRDARSVRTLLGKVEVSAADAARIATGKAPGAVEEIELDDRGTAWKVELDDKDDDRDLLVDTATGKVTVLNDDDRDDDRDDADDDRDDADDDRGDDKDDRDDDDDKDDRDDRGDDDRDDR
ncbi:PepSY domain-containing protein [Streptomyces sparsus]